MYNQGAWIYFDSISAFAFSGPAIPGIPAIHPPPATRTHTHAHTHTHPHTHTLCCVAKRNKGNKGKKRVSKQKLLKSCNQGQNVNVLAILQSWS